MHKIFGSTVQNLVTWPTTRPEFVHPWCILTAVTEILDMSTVSGYEKSQSVSGNGTASVSVEVRKREHPARRTH